MTTKKPTTTTKTTTTTKKPTTTTKTTTTTKKPTTTTKTTTTTKKTSTTTKKLTTPTTTTSTPSVFTSKFPEGCGVPVISPNTTGLGRIVGGIPAIENSWPWQVLIKGKNETSGANWTCGGVILFENVIKISWTTISVKLIFFFYNLRFILSGFSLLDTVLVMTPTPRGMFMQGYTMFHNWTHHLYKKEQLNNGFWLVKTFFFFCFRFFFNRSHLNRV